MQQHFSLIVLFEPRKPRQNLGQDLALTAGLAAHVMELVQTISVPDHTHLNDHGIPILQREPAGVDQYRMISITDHLRFR